MDHLRITVVGAGPVGTNLAVRFAELGHHVTFAARDTSSPKVVAAVERVPGARVARLAGSAGDADLTVLAVPYSAIDDALDQLGDVAVLVDATNAVGVALPDAVTDIPQLIARRRPDVTVVKAFNTIGAEAFLDPVVEGRRCFLPIAGPAPAADQVRDLAEAMGFDAVVIGGLDAAPLMEWHARLWIHLAFRVGGGRDFGFARVRRGGG